MSKEHLVDFRVFKKTMAEKIELANVKRKWKQEMIMFYGLADWKKYNNYPETLKD